MEAGRNHLGCPSAQWSEISLADRSRSRRVGKGGGIDPLVDVVLAAVSVLSRHKQGVAADSRCPSCDTVDGLGLAVVQCENSIHAPSPENCTADPASTAQV